MHKYVLIHSIQSEMQSVLLEYEILVMEQLGLHHSIYIHSKPECFSEWFVLVFVLVPVFVLVFVIVKGVLAKMSLCILLNMYH